MKRITISLLLTCIAVISFATDFYVAESFDNTNNRFNTISAAIAAASDGDRIYVQDKPGAGYVEDLNIDKSISLINMNNNEKFTVTGTLPLTTKNRITINIIGIELNGQLKNTNETFTNANLNVYNSIFSDSVIVSMGQASDKQNMIFVNTTFNRYSHFSLSKMMQCIGCQFIDGATFLYIDGLEIKGCAFLNHMNNFTIINSLKIENSYFLNTKVLNERFCNIYLQYCDTANITNNTFHLLDPNFHNIRSERNDSTLFLINNNIFSSRPLALWYYTRNIKVSFNYNIINHDDVLLLHSNVTYKFISENANILNANTQIDSLNYSCTGDNINAGDPDPLMSDLDLTRNDAGCHGGPNSISNYFPQNDAGARVYKIEMPRRFFTGSNVNIKAYGVDK